MILHRSKQRKGRDGLSLIEVIVGLSLVGILVLTYGTTLTAAVASRRIKQRNMAAALADIQLSALRTFDPSSIPVQTNGAVYGILFTKGEWNISTDGSAKSGSQVFHTEAATSTGITSLSPLPLNAYDDFTYSAEIKVDSSSPALWQAGILFRSQDLQNGYRVYLTSGTLVLERLIDGTVTTLFSDVRSVSTDTWHNLEVTTNGSSISIDLNGGNVTSEVDATYAFGKAALAAWEGAEVRFDDVVMDGTTWDMDSETLGEPPSGWERFGLSDLPSGDMTLTSENLYGDSGFKRYTATVTWSDASGDKTLSQTTDVTN